MRRAKGLFRHFRSVAATVLVAGALAGCQDVNTKAAKPIPSETLALMEKKGTSKSAPMLIRAYKKEAELEVWKQKSDGQYALLKKYPMCRWSGQLGPKTREGDRQVPEGFYNITPGQMNPNSSYYLSFNVGYPNAFDRAHGRGGGLIMVHGACSSAGCFSMTDDQIAEIYAIARESFAGGQRAIGHCAHRSHAAAAIDHAAAAAGERTTERLGFGAVDRVRSLAGCAIDTDAQPAGRTHCASALFASARARAALYLAKSRS